MKQPLIFIWLFLFQLTTWAAVPQCVDLFEKQNPYRYVGGDSNRLITFGLEAELNTRENPNIVLDYRHPDYSDAARLRLSFDERVAMGIQRDKKFGLSMTRVAYVKLKTAPSYLPERLEYEGDGNFEINGLIFKKLNDARDFIELLNNRYGPSSIQGHVAFLNQEMVGASGYAIFSADRAQLSSLSRNYQLHLKDPAFKPAKNLLHHSIRMTELSFGVTKSV
jgi:hypothetical protein